MRRVHAAVVELDALADPVRSRAEDDDPRPAPGPHLVLVLVGRVVVRRLGRELGAAGVDRLEGRARRPRASRAARTSLLRQAEPPGELRVGEAEPLQPPPVRSARRPRRPAGGPSASASSSSQRRARRRSRASGRGTTGRCRSPRRPVSTRGAAAQRRLELEGPLGVGSAAWRTSSSVGHGAVGRLCGVAVEPESALLEAAQRLLQRLGEGPADRHHLADRLHPGAEAVRRAGQLLEGPAGDLRHDVVDRRLEARRRRPGDVVRGSRRACSRPRGGPRSWRSGSPVAFEASAEERETLRVHLDDEPLPPSRVDGELDVRAAGLDADAADAGEGGVAHLLVLDVRERLGRGDGDRVAGVHAHRVEVLDRADDDAVVGAVAHHLELELLPAGDRALDEDLADRARREARGGEAPQLVPVGGDAGARAAEDERRPDHDREADRARRWRAPRRGRGRSPSPGTSRPISVIASLNSSRSSAVRIASVFAPISSTPSSSSTPARRERHRQVERRLAAQRREERVGALALDDRGRARRRRAARRRSGPRDRGRS